MATNGREAAVPAAERARPEPRARAAEGVALGSAVQIAWILGVIVLGAAAAYAAVFTLLPGLARGIGSVPLALSLPALAFAAELLWLPLALGAAVFAKGLLIGRYRAGRHRYLGGFYVRNWIVQQCSRAIPWSLIEGSALQIACLRALGARIGRNVHIHRGVDLSAGGWDLLEIGDDVTIGRDAALGLVELHDRQLVLAPVRLAQGCTLDTRARIAGHACMERNAYLTCLSSLPAGVTIPAGETWDGVPAAFTWPAPATPEATGGARAWPAAQHAAVLVLLRGAVAALRFMPGLAAATLFMRAGGTPLAGPLLPPPFESLPIAWVPALLVLGYVLSLPLEALMVRALGRVWAGTHPLRGWTGIALALKDGMVETANGALSGTLLWPWWLRAAGARVGRKCEISTIMEVVPELLSIGDECFLADGIYLGRPRLHRGFATCGETSLSKNTFLGNHVVVPGGVSLPGNILLGICTVADPSKLRPGTSWFGHPPFELPRREIAASERGLTHDPTWDRYATRVVFELARFALPLVPMLLAWVAFVILPLWRAQQPAGAFFLLTLPACAIAAGVLLLLLAVFTKWFVLGPIREGRHPLWSCWCCRWDILFEVWAAWALPVVSRLEGTAFVAWWLRAMGCRIGRGVVFGSSFLQVVDPDMLEIRDEATVSCHIQSHSFEDRVLKLAPVRIGAGSSVGRGAVLLYGAEIGDRAEVGDNSIVMKHEVLPAGGRYAGCPTRAAD